MENFLICCMKNWKYGGKFFKKKLSEHARLLGSSEYLGKETHENIDLYFAIYNLHTQIWVASATPEHPIVNWHLKDTDLKIS